MKTRLSIAFTALFFSIMVGLLGASDLPSTSAAAPQFVSLTPTATPTRGVRPLPTATPQLKSPTLPTRSSQTSKSPTGSDVWTGNGPEGGVIYQLTIDPKTPNTLYAVTRDGGAFKSTNGGMSWSTINNGLPILYLYALVIDPMTPSTLYAGTYGGGVFKSTNGGASWSASSNGLPTPYAYVNALAVDPATPSTLYAGTDFGGIFKSTNGGASWSASNNGLTDPNVRALAIDPKTLGTLYAVTNEQGVFKSTNGGTSWSTSNNGLANADARALAIDPVTPSTLYAGTFDLPWLPKGTGGVFKSTNGGASWSAINNGLTTTDVAALAIDPQTPSTLYAGTWLGGVFKSIDAGASWSAINNGLTSDVIEALAIDPVMPSTLYAGAWGGGVFKSTNGGVSWSTINNGLTSTAVQALAINPVTPSTLYAGTNLDGAFKSTNSGTGWSAIYNGLTASNVTALAINPATPSTLYAGASTRPAFNETAGVFKSTNGGANWTATNYGLTNTNVHALAIDPVTPSTLYAGTSGDGVFKSTNGGTSWSAFNNGLTGSSVAALAIDPVTPSTLYAGTWFGGAFKSTNSGTSWSAINTGLTNADVAALVIDPVTPSTLYAGTNGGVFKSTNGGASWSAINNGLTTTDVAALAIDPVTPSTLYAGTYGGVFRSTNGGTGWSAINNGLTNTNVHALAIDPVTPSTVYAGTWGGGVFSMSQTLDIGFRPNPNGYQFSNIDSRWGWYPLSPANGDYTIDDMRQMFGDSAVCQSVIGSTCIIKPTALSWLIKVNWKMNGGHCDGFTTTSLRVFKGLDNASAFQSGANTTHDLQLGNARRHIAYYWVLQIPSPVKDARYQTLQKTPVQILNQLRTVFSTGASDPTTLIFYNSNGTLAHSVTPYGIEDRGNGISRVRVYDNNYPDDPTRYVEINTVVNTWSYDMGGNTFWSGGPKPGSLGAIPISIYAQQAQCDWCSSASSTSQQVWLTGQGHLLITNSIGQRIGYVSNQFIDEIPNAFGSVPPGGLGVREEPLYTIPLANAYTILLDGQTLTQTQTVAVTQFGSGYATSAEDVVLSPTSQDNLIFSSNGTQLAFRPNATKSVTLTLALDSPSQSNQFQVRGVNIDAGKAVTLTANTNNGRLLLDNRQSSTNTYTLAVSRVSGAGTQYFTHSGISILATDTHQVDYGGWNGVGPVTLYIDHGSDGTIDQIIVLNNETPPTYLPFIGRP